MHVFFQSMLVTVSEQCEKKLLAVKQEEKSGTIKKKNYINRAVQQE